MGALYEYKCKNCAYQAEVSGGRDRGFASGTCTIICHDCKDLFDVTTWEGDDNIDEEAYQRLLVCPNSPKHRAAEWRHPGACPKCGSTLEQYELTVLWD